MPVFANEVAKFFGRDALEKGVLVRDAGGRLSIVLSTPIDSEQLESASVALSDALGEYARPDRVIAGCDGPGSSRLLREAESVYPSHVAGFNVRIIDRRIVGADWLRGPVSTSKGIPRLIFASLKGGVGRSTALCVLAAHLSRRGRRVLAIDFDLEAPGIGTMLLDETELPQFGTLDYLVESGLGGLDDAFMTNLSGDSYLGSEGGRVTVVPAIGTATLNNPENALGKISRAYVESISESGVIKGLGDKLQDLVSWYEATGAYDVILIDARAGLHETTAGAILVLGGETFLFGVDQPQTFLGYRLLMAHLARFPANLEDDWRANLHFVHAKASDDPKQQMQAEERFNSLFDLVQTQTKSAAREEKMRPEELTENDFNVEWTVSSDVEDDELGFVPPPLLRVLDDSRYKEFDPIAKRTLLSSNTYLATFGELLSYVDELVYDINVYQHQS